jgi:hypothetical protein
LNFIQKLFSSSSTKPEKAYYIFSVKCLRCGEIIEGRVNLDNDLSVEYESDRDVYFARKVLMGNNKCFQRMEVELKFSSTRELLEQHVTGGGFI